MLRFRALGGGLVLLGAVFAESAPADPMIRWQPISSTGSYTIDGTTIHLPGGPAEVTFEIVLSGWGSAAGAPELGAYQGTLVSAGYENGVGDPLVPKGWPGTPEDGAFIDHIRADFPFRDLTPLAGVMTTTLDYEWGGSGVAGTFPDGGGDYYGGVLIVEVPAGAGGTYVIDWNPSEIKTFLNDQTAQAIPGLVRQAATIEIPIGRCCASIGLVTATCRNNYSQTMCDAMPAPRDLLFDETCANCGCPDCETDPDCNDFDVCTSETCDLVCGCQYTLLYNSAVDCCNAADGTTAPFDDGNDCTFDYCLKRCTLTGGTCYLDSECPGGSGDLCQTTSEAEHWLYPEEQVCSNANECIINDHCDGAGTCIGTLPADLDISCTEDGDCPGQTWFCNPLSSKCDCHQASIHDIRKNRYISFYPAPSGILVSFHVTIADCGLFTGSTGPVGWVGAPDGDGIARIVDTARFSNSWPEVVHVGDCAILPDTVYEIRASLDGIGFSDPVLVETAAQPDPKFWADVVGPVMDNTWTEPNGIVNMDDIFAAIQRFNGGAIAPPLIWVDVDPETPNIVVNMTDVQQIVGGFKGNAYPFSAPVDCP